MRRLLDDLWDLSCIAMPVVAVVGAPAAVVAGAVGAWWAAAPLAVAAAGSLAFTAWPRRTVRAPVPTDGMRIVAVNLWYKNDAMGEAATQILAWSPDIVIVSELGQAAHDVLVEAFPYHDVLEIGGPRGHGVFSRFPLERLAFRRSGFGPMLQVRVHGPNPFQLFAAHLPRATMKRHPSHGTEPVHVCREGVFAVAREVAAEPDAMLAGDLNLTDRQPGYRRLIRGRLDAMRTAPARNTFLGITWRLMAMRIDHMIVPADWAVSDARAFRVAGSDHMAITAVVQPAPT